MWTRTKIIDFLINRDQEADALAGLVPYSTEWYCARAVEEEKQGKGITMNSLARTVPRPKPPRRPSWG
jgi:hypothetical protein